MSLEKQHGNLKGMAIKIISQHLQKHQEIENPRQALGLVNPG